MADKVFRSMRLLCCDTCSQQWFGAAGEVAAREHANDTWHQVRIEYLTRETLNEVSQAHEPTPSEQVALSADDLKLSREAAIARLEADGVAA